MPPKIGDGPLTANELAKLCYLAKNASGACVAGAPKGEFRRLGRRVLQRLADDLKLPKGSYEICFNPGGVAVTGESILHHERIYVHLGWDMSGNGFFYRRVKDRNDYIGYANRQWKYSDLARWADFVRAVHIEMGGHEAFPLQEA